MTELGIVILVKSLQNSNALFPIAVTVFGIVDALVPFTILLVAVSIIALQLSRLSKLSFSLSTTMLLRFSQSENALLPIVATDLPK